MAPLLWLDLETTGLDQFTDRILEAAWTITNDHLVPAPQFDDGEGITIVEAVVTIGAEEWSLIESSPFIQDMHGESGLLGDLMLDRTLLLSDIEEAILRDLDKVEAMCGEGDDEKVVWYPAGASVHFDLGFIRVWMPRLADRLSHRVYDTSTLKAFFSDFIDIPASLVNKGKHRAGNDVQEVLSIARHYSEQMSFANQLITELTEQGILEKSTEPRA